MFIKQLAQNNYEDFRHKANTEYVIWLRQVWEWHRIIVPMARGEMRLLRSIVI